MKPPIRLENAITKLYTAFHNNELDAYKCSACAVGNICDNSDNWGYSIIQFTPKYLDKTTIEKLSQNLKHDSFTQASGYSISELAYIEKLFLLSHDTKEDLKTMQFKGLCAVVEYLCELDNIPNVMDYTKLFETESDKPKYQLNN